MTDKKLLTVRIVVGLVAIWSYLLGYFLYTDTLISLRDSILIPLTVVTIAAPLVYKKWRWVTASKNSLLNLVCHFLVGGGIVFGSFLFANVPLGTDAQEFTEKTIVQKKAIVKSRNTRRVGRRSYVTTGYSNSYCLWVALHDSVSRKQKVSREAYYRVRTGDTVTAVLCEGRFGYPLINKIKVPKRALEKKRNRDRKNMYAIRKLMFQRQMEMGRVKKEE